MQPAPARQAQEHQFLAQQDVDPLHRAAIDLSYQSLSTGGASSDGWGRVGRAGLSTT